MTENALSRLVLLLALWPVGCVGGGRDSQDVTDEVIGGFLADVAGRHTGYAGLCAEAVPSGECAAIVLGLTIELCLDCRSVGWLLREFRRRAPHMSVVVVVDVDDAAFVKQYLRRERVTAAVVPVGPPMRPAWWPLPEDRIVTVRVSRRGDAPGHLQSGLIAAFAASDGFEILRIWDQEKLWDSFHLAER